MKQPTLPEFRALVEQALAAAQIQLGTHYWPADDQGNVRVTPALFVGEPPEGVTAQGLEVLIPATPEMTVITTFAGPITIDHYPVRAVAHDGRSLKPVWAALATAFRKAGLPQVLQATDRYPDQILVPITP